MAELLTPEFLGRGWAFPITLAPDGDLQLVDAEDDVRQAIMLILETEPGERMMRPDFGCGLRSLAFEPINTNTAAVAGYKVQQALIKWEPRVDVLDVSVTPDGQLGKLLIEVAYRIRATNTFYNLVYPFYLREGAV